MSNTIALPGHWLTTLLADVSDIQLGKMLDKKKVAGSSYPYLRNINVRWGYVNTNDLLEMPFQEHETERYSLCKGDVLVCEGGEPGRAAVWQYNDSDIKYQKALHRVRLFGDIDPKWLVYQLYLDAQQGRLSRFFTGTTIKHFTRTAMKEYGFRLAPCREQHRILDAIETHFTRLDAAVETLKRVQANLKRYRASVLKAAVEGRLVPTEAELARREGRDYEPASKLLDSVLIERRRRWEEAELVKMRAKGKEPKNDKWKAKYKEPLGPEQATLPVLREGWYWARLGQLMSIRSGFAFKSKDYCHEGVPLVRQADLKGEVIDLSGAKQLPAIYLREYWKYHVKEGDLLIGMSGAIGKVSFYAQKEAALQNQRTGLVVPYGPISLQFLAMLIESQEAHLLNCGKGVAVQNISPKDIERCNVALPPLAEQNRIVAELQKQFSEMDFFKRSTVTNAHRCERLRKSILKWAFEGKLVDQDSSDEPASVLLDRIRAERQAEDKTRKTKKKGRPARRSKEQSTDKQLKLPV